MLSATTTGPETNHQPPTARAVEPLDRGVRAERDGDPAYRRAPRPPQHQAAPSLEPTARAAPAPPTDDRVPAGTAARWGRARLSARSCRCRRPVCAANAQWRRLPALRSGPSPPGPSRHALVGASLACELLAKPASLPARRRPPPRRLAPARGRGRREPPGSLADDSLAPRPLAKPASLPGRRRPPPRRLAPARGCGRREPPVSLADASLACELLAKPALLPGRRDPVNHHPEGGELAPPLALAPGAAPRRARVHA